MFSDPEPPPVNHPKEVSQNFEQALDERVEMFEDPTESEVSISQNFEPLKSAKPTESNRPNQAKASEQAAKLTGTNRQYVADAKVWSKVDGLLQRSKGGQPENNNATKGKETNVDNVNIRIERPTGNSKAATLRRLKKDAPHFFSLKYTIFLDKGLYTG